MATLYTVYKTPIVAAGWGRLPSICFLSFANMFDLSEFWFSSKAFQVWEILSFQINMSKFITLEF